MDQLEEILERIFQSTLLQEERRDDQKRMITIYNFNPRSYKRSDAFFIDDFSFAKFQSTLLQEERPVYTFNTKKQE